MILAFSPKTLLRSLHRGSDSLTGAYEAGDIERPRIPTHPPWSAAVAYSSEKKGDGRRSGNIDNMLFESELFGPSEAQTDSDDSELEDSTTGRSNIRVWFIWFVESRFAKIIIFVCIMVFFSIYQKRKFSRVLDAKGHSFGPGNSNLDHRSNLTAAMNKVLQKKGMNPITQK